MPRLSRSHWTSEPATAMDPSSAYCGAAVPSWYPTRGQQSVRGLDDLLAGVDQHKAPGAVRVLGLAGVEAAWPNVAAC